MSVTKDERISYALTFMMLCVAVVGIYSIYCVSDAEHVNSARLAFKAVRMAFGRHYMVG